MVDAWSITLFSLVALALTSLWLLTRKRTCPPLPPGPYGLPIVGNLLSLEPELPPYFSSLAKVHGPIFSLWLGSKFAVVVTSPALAKEVLRDHDVTFANRNVPLAARTASYGGHDIVWNPLNGPEWRLLRKVSAREMIGATALDAMYGLRRRELRRTIKYLASQAGSPVNIGEQVFLISMNVMTNMMWGGAVEVGGEEQRERLGKEFRKVVADITCLLGEPNVSDFIPAMAWFDLQGVVNKMRTCFEKFDEIFERVISERLRMDNHGKGIMEKDFLQVLLKMVKDGYEEGSGDGGNKVKFSMTHLKALLMDMVVAGTDTTSNTIEFAIAELMNKPELIKKVQGELDAVVGKDNIVEEHHIWKLPYLHTVMKETVRLHPVVPLFPHRPSESSIIGGHTVPKDSQVFIIVWAIHRDPSIWDDPLVFDPDRFVDAKFDFSGNDFTYLPFGSGRRTCPGMIMAERMVLFTLASLLHSFDWELPKGEILDLEEKFGALLSKKIPLVLVPKPRLCDPTLYQ